MLNDRFDASRYDNLITYKVYRVEHMMKLDGVIIKFLDVFSPGSRFSWKKQDDRDYEMNDLIHVKN